MAPHRKDGWQDRFISVYEECGVIATSCKASGIGRRTYYRELARNDEFKARMAEAQIAAIKRLEDVAYERAIDHSDTMLIFLLKANKPDKYRENLSVRHGGTVNVESDVDAAIRELLGEMDRREQAKTASGTEEAPLAADSK